MKYIKRNKLKKIILVEFYKYHTEILYSQLLFLKQSNCRIFLIGNCQSDLANVSALAHDTRLFDFNESKPFMKSLIDLLILLYKEKPDVLILNTAQGPKSMYFSLLYWSRKTKLVGVYHNVQKFESSLAQRIIAFRFKHAFVLADYIKQYFPPRVGMHCESFMASFFGPLEGKLIKPKDEFWVCIPGALEFKRRDYVALMQSAHLDSSVKFILLGRSNTTEGELLRSMVEERGLCERFVFFDGYVPTSVFNDYVISSDLIMPLIHPNMSGFRHYLRNKISGTMNIAYAFEKPMYFHSTLNELSEYVNAGISYDTETMFERLNAIVRGEVVLPEVKNVDFNGVCKKYLAFLE